MPRILVVDDDAGTCRFMQELLAAEDRVIDTAQVPARALEHVGAGYDLVIADLNLNARQSGLDLLRAFKKADPEVEVVLISGFGTLQTAVEAVRAGAFDYVSKPIDIGEVKATVARALRHRARAGGEGLRGAMTDAPPPEGLVGRSRGMLEAYKQIAQASASEAPVLVTGETGTGKELVARAVHRYGRRAARAFITVNCGALTEGLLESELFGHVRGAFTGAVSDKKGLFEEADGGTLFLDEIGETSPAVQVRLLRALELGEVRRVGAARAATVDVRVLAATHRALEGDVASGRFRQDLFYRLSVLRIAMPPLRERPEDIELLAVHFLRSAALRAGRPLSLTPAALGILAGQPWPGNVRELENTVERLAATARGVIDAEDLPESLRRGPSWQEQAFADLPTLDELEKRYLQHVLAALGGNRSRAAEVLGVDRRTLYRMAERLGVQLPGPDDR